MGCAHARANRPWNSLSSLCRLRQRALPWRRCGGLPKMDVCSPWRAGTRPTLWDPGSLPRSKIFRGIEMFRGIVAALRRCDGQASVEAALLIPSLFVLIALLVQPACLLYTRSMMSHAASEGARLAVTAMSDQDVVDFVRRRLKAVPEVGLFHSGGEDDWQISVSGVGGGGACVSIEGHAKPLPLTAAIAGAIAGSDGQGVLLKVDMEVSERADWVEGSYGSWVGMWE